jgi:hypothetical protein
MSVNYGLVPRPPMLTMIVPKSYDGAGYDSCPPRKIVGVCGHITDGGSMGSDQEEIDWYYNFVALGGERHDSALWDFLIATHGTIAMFNDPYGRRRPWANGWGSEGPGLEGDGPAFVNTFGAYGTNFNLASVERVGKSPNPMTDAQMTASINLWAWLFDAAEVSYESYPVNQHYGINTDLQHFEFAQKPCPGQGIRDQTAELQAGVTARLKSYQLAADFPPIKQFPKPDGFDHNNFKACIRKVKVRRGGGAELFQYAGAAAPKTGKPLPKNSIVPVAYVIKNAEGNWYVHENGHRMRQSHFYEQMSATTSE